VLHQDVIPADVLDPWLPTSQGCQQPVYDCAVHRATTRNVVAAISRESVPHIWISHCFTLINLLHRHPPPPSTEPWRMRFCPFYRSSNSPISLGHPHPQLREASAVARSLTTVIVHVGACLKLYQACSHVRQKICRPGHRSSPRVVQHSRSHTPFRPSEGPLGRSPTTIFYIYHKQQHDVNTPLVYNCFIMGMAARHE